MKKKGGKGVVEIDDGGGEGLGELRPDGEVVGGSRICLKSFGEKEEDSGREMRNEEIEEGMKDFGEGRGGGIEGGFDGVEIDGGND